MAYTTPRTWVAGELVTATIMNTHVRDNLTAAFPLAVGAWTAFTPTLAQSGSVAKTTSHARYMKVGRTVFATIELAVTAAGTAGNDVVVGLPVAHMTFGGSGPHIGTMLIYDASTTTRYQGAAELRSTTTVGLSISQASAAVWGTGPSIALANGDVIRLSLQYEAAS